LKKFLVLFLLGIIVLFTAQNYEVVEIRFLIWSFQMSRAVVIFLSLVFGLMIGWLTASRATREW